MEIVKNIPATDVTIKVTEITFNLESKIARVNMLVDGQHQQKEIPVTSIIQAALTAQKTVIRGFFKKVIAEAIAVTENDITDTIFPEN